MKSKKAVSIVGCGWLGRALGRSLSLQGYDVRGSTRTVEKLVLLKEEGILPFIFDATQREGEVDKDLFMADIIVINIPPGRRNPNVVADHPKEIKHIIEAAKGGTIKELIFVSSTGVYGNTKDWADEKTTLNPMRNSGKALEKAEELISKDALPFTILRMSGLIGGERQPSNWVKGKEDIPFGNTPVNMINRPDCVKAIQTVIDHSAENEIYNLTAGQHPTRAVFYKAQCEKAGVKVPTFQDEIGPHKLVSNEKFKKRYNFEYQFDDPANF